MKNRTIAKLLVCSTVLANLPVAAMANEVQTLAADNNVWSNSGSDWTYTLSSDTTLWGTETGTYTLDKDSTYKILFDTAVNANLGSDVSTTNTLTIEGKGASTSNFNLNGNTIKGAVTFAKVNVVGDVNRTNATVDETVTINGKAVVTVTGADGANVTVSNASGNFANGAGLALVGDVLTVTPAEGYRIDTLKGLTPVVVGSDSDQYTVNGAVEITVVPEDQPVDPTYITSTVNITGNGKVTYTIAGDTTVYDVVEGKLTAEEGKEVTLKAEAAEGNELKSVTIYGEAKDTAGTYTFTVAEGVISVEFAEQTAPETDVWEKQEDGTYVLDITKLTGTELVVPESTATYIIKSGTELGVTDVKVGKGSTLRIESGVTFNNEITFTLGGRLIAQTTNFKGQVWFTALTSNTRIATLATGDGTVELEGVVFERKVNIEVPTTTTTGTTKFNGGAQVDDALTVASNSTLEIASSVSGAGSIASEGTLNVTSGTVETAIAVNGGTTTVAEGATVGEVNVTAGSATVNGTANKVVVASENATVNVGATAEIDTVDATNGTNVNIAPGASVDKVISETPIEGLPSFGIQFKSTGTGTGTLMYGETAADLSAVQDVTVYINKADTSLTDLAVQFAAQAEEGSKFVSATINGTEFTTPEFAYTIAKDTTVVVNVQFDLENGGTTDPDEPGTEEPGENQVAYTVNIGEGGSVTYKLAGDAVVKTLTSGSVNLTKGGSYTLTVTANEGYEIDTVTVDGTALTGTNGVYQFTALTENTGSIAVTFKTSGETPETQVKYTASIDEGGSVTYQEVGSTAEAVALKDGESVTLTKGKSYQLKVEADSSYEVDAVKVNGSELEEKDGVYTFTAGDADGAIAVTFSYVGGGSIGGGGSGGGSTGGGSSTSGTTSTVTVSASTSVSGKIMTATVSASNMEKAVKDVLALAEKNNTTPVVKVSLSLGTSVEGISVNLPTEALKALAAVSNAKLTIESSVASVTFDANALSDVLSQAGETFTLNAGKADMSNFTAAQLLGAGEGSVYDINITSDGNAITNFDGGSATVTLPYALKVGENASDIVVYYMADNGILDSQSTQYDAANRKATFTTSHFSIYVVDAAWANPFNDVYEGDWFYNAVRYANENSLMAGVSDTTFAPNMNLTRAMVVQMLYSLEGKPAVVSGGNFSDVKASDWYADAVNWAASKGIVSGYSETTYAPNDSVTREQLSLILYKYAQSKNVTVNDYSSLSGFVDAAKTSDWAEDAVEWAVGAGLISSTSTSTKTLDPTGTATRAQVAQIVANFVEQVM